MQASSKDGMALELGTKNKAGADQRETRGPRGPSDCMAERPSAESSNTGRWAGNAAIITSQGQPTITQRKVWHWPIRCAQQRRRINATTTSWPPVQSEQRLPCRDAVPRRASSKGATKKCARKGQKTPRGAKLNAPSTKKEETKGTTKESNIPPPL